jgi:hypothetical protein
MPRIADYKVIQDDAFTLPGNPPEASGSDRHFQFPLPNVAGPPAILSLRIRPTGSIKLKARLNDSDVFDRPFNTGPDRSFHEVINDPKALKKTGNELVMSVSEDGPGESVRVSDIVIFFQTEVGTVIGS